MIPWLRMMGVIALVGPAACTSNTIELDTGSGPDPMGTTGTDPYTSSADFTADDDGTTAGPCCDLHNPTDPSVTITATATEDVPMPESVPFLLAISTILEPSLPVQGLVWLTPAGNTIDLELQWLSLDPGSTTTPREPVGDIYFYPAIPLDADGGFTWDTGVILLPGAANPITGSDVVLSAVLQATPVAQPYCGRVFGEITSPIQVPLDESTHAMTALPDPELLPTEFLSTCP